LQKFSQGFTLGLPEAQPCKSGASADHGGVHHSNVYWFKSRLWLSIQCVIIVI